MASEKFIVVDFCNRISKCLLLPEYDSPNEHDIGGKTGPAESCGLALASMEIWTLNVKSSGSTEYTRPRWAKTEDLDPAWSNLKPNKVFLKKSKKQE